MECPKCGYEPTMAELQRSPDNCLKCSGSFQAIARSSAGAPKHRRKLTVATIVVAVIALICAGFYLGIVEYRRQAVLTESGSYMRAANGFVAEMLDEKANRTTAEFLGKLPRRVQSLDDLNAQVLAMDDSDLPGIKSATADYIRASRSFLLSFADLQRAEIGYSAMKAGHAVYESYASTAQGRADLARSDEQMRAEQNVATKRQESAGAMSEKIAALGASAKVLERSKKRMAYLMSVEDVEESARQLENAKGSFDAARTALSTAGRKISELANEPMPVQPWHNK